MTWHVPHFQLHFSSRFKMLYLCQFCINWLEIWNVNLSTLYLGASSVLCPHVKQYKIHFWAPNIYPLQCNCCHCPKYHLGYLVNSEHLRNILEKVLRQSQFKLSPFACATVIYCLLYMTWHKPHFLSYFRLIFKMSLLTQFYMDSFEI